MRIDIHVHSAKKRHPKILRQIGGTHPTPEQLISIMDANGIDKAAMMTGASPERRWMSVSVEETLEICEQYPSRFIPFCNLDPRFLMNDTTSDFTPLLEAYKELGCKGVGEFMPNIPFDDPLCMNLFEDVEKAGLPLTFHIAPQQGSYYGVVDEVGLPRMERVLKTFPELKLLGHSQLFWAEIGNNLLDENGRRIPYPKGPVTPGKLVQLMQTYPNLLGDLSAGSGYNAISRDRKFGCTFIEEFQDRLYFGTDVANEEQELPIVAYLDELRDSGEISSQAYEKLTWRNAAQLLELKELL
jgi:hypothetical protein